MAATFAASHQSTIGIPFGAPDYVAHAVNYAVLGALLVRALAGGHLHLMAAAQLLPAAILAALYGLSDEFHQSFVPGRDASGTDLVADAVGAIIGAASAVALGALVRGFRSGSAE
jgi:VanZ family protein